MIEVVSVKEYRGDSLITLQRADGKVAYILVPVEDDFVWSEAPTETPSYAGHACMESPNHHLQDGVLHERAGGFLAVHGLNMVMAGHYK